MSEILRMYSKKRLAMTAWVITMLVMPIISIPLVAAYEPGDEAAIFGHTFTEEYWTNDSIDIQAENGNASLTASFVHVDTFQAFMIAFNTITTNDSKEIILPYQLFGMHYSTPEGQEVFIGAIFAFLMVHNESFGGNNLPDVGNEDAWYVVPITTANPWLDVTPSVEAIPVTKLGTNHYRFGMRYTNITARIVSADSPGGFALSLLFPILTVLISELVIEYDITIHDTTGEVHAETLYTLGQVHRARWLGLFPAEPSTLINDTMQITAVHYLSVFTSNYRVTSATTGNTITPPTSTTPLDDNITIQVGDDNERAFDIGMGRQYALLNESTDPWTTISESEDTVNALLGARAGDFLLVAWQAPLSAFVFAHMAYGLSDQIRSTYNSVESLVSNAGTAFHNSQWWYAVSFPEWNGLRVEQDPVYTAYTSAFMPTSPTTPTTPTGTTPDDGGGGIFLLVLLGIGVVAIVIIIRRR